MDRRDREERMDVQCELCPKNCLIKPGQSGDCRIRVNADGKLLAVTYGHPCSVHIDPVEKKPVFHFLPNTKILSLATVGCNLHCLNCQNWEISQCNPEDMAAALVPPDKIVELAEQYQCPSIAYTYTDPVVYYEYTLDTCRAAVERGLKNVLVTAAYINAEPWKKLCRHVAAITVDIKALSESFYRDICKATLQPILNALTVAKSMGVHVEVSNLVIPTLNDGDEDFQNITRWIARNLGRETPTHFLQYFPRYKMLNIPPTPAETLARARKIAQAEGLYFVYIGNVLVGDSENTYCPKCRRLLVERQGHAVLKNDISKGACPDCKGEVYGVWQ